MGSIKQFRNRELSLWQSAVDEVLAKDRKIKAIVNMLAPGDRDASIISDRPEMNDKMMEEVTAFCALVDKGQPITEVPYIGSPGVLGVSGWMEYCSKITFELAKAFVKGNKEDMERYMEELGKFTDCDRRYGEAVAKYIEYFIIQAKTIPYRRHQKLSDFVIDGKLPPNAKVALVADFGTGQQSAKNVLAQIARKNPDVVIHLRDIYYSGTDFEVENYFYEPWCQILNLSGTTTKTVTYTLSGNHDMYSGGQPYYMLIDELRQPASYFCLRNDHWQFLAMDTGLNDHDPIGGEATFLEDTELEWLKDKITTSGTRKNVLLSHHQLFSAYEEIGGKHFNQRLYDKLLSVLPAISLWFWGHEHNLVIFEKYMGVLGRCIGCGAFPVGIDELPLKPVFSNVPVKDVKLGKGSAFYNHGYVIMELNGPTATVSYYQDSDEDKPLFKEIVEDNQLLGTV